jgi:hypothetical protein
VFEGWDFAERMSRRVFGGCPFRCENIDRDKLVVDAFFFQSEANSAHVDAVRRTENDWVICRLHQVVNATRETRLRSKATCPQDLFKLVSPNTEADCLIARHFGSLLANQAVSCVFVEGYGGVLYFSRAKLKAFDASAATFVFRELEHLPSDTLSSGQRINIHAPQFHRVI